MGGGGGANYVIVGYHLVMRVFLGCLEQAVLLVGLQRVPVSHIGEPPSEIAHIVNISLYKI